MIISHNFGLGLKGYVRNGLANEFPVFDSCSNCSCFGPEQWTELVGDQGVMTVILDRLLHRVEMVHMNSDSYRPID